MTDFVVVSKASKDDTGYESAVVFNNPAKEADNEAEANDYLRECKAQRPYQAHSVVTREDFDKAAKDAADAAAAPADPAPADSAPADPAATPAEH